MNLGKFIGIPFVNGGRDVRTGLDCWGLAMKVFEAYGVALPDFTVDAFAFEKISELAGKSIMSRQWEEVYAPANKDVPLVVLMRMHPALITHAGVYIGDGRIIHTMESTDSVISKVGRLKNTIVGYYRPC